MTLDIPDAPTFFRLSCGSWRSQRSVHHLLHRRSEAGGSLIVVEDLELNDERLLAMARQHDQDPGLIIGGSYVRWSASMAWDRDGDAHDGETCFALVGESETARSGTMLRDQGYAEKSPATSTFDMDDRDGLILCTSYGMMTVWERFSFSGPDARIRSSTVEGLSNNASFCVETRLKNDSTSTGPEGITALASPFGW
ncbi:phycocyanobilin:Cys-84 beta-phycocyanin lyase [Synechococcus sp. BIOS-U3-1]|uniref:phycobiliprotein lyase n=1 Tax=Synechococcus sp. BIOS-U3-1 TaxID=1400865 RepID=UPI00164583A8|nr:phycobiliprotein lyase [Synechococcus sp. BIOS-U3-1]QNI59896.1 phycocyanobilin:Cys-84 beta-phycocyanin lyase [Synechococcus sp. BIOS-U3-1]|tara:strand:- start:1047 stop:1637 length:591 start_codon:yes stop_codon:yes gene_type:complete